MFLHISEHHDMLPLLAFSQLMHVVMCYTLPQLTFFFALLLLCSFLYTGLSVFCIISPSQALATLWSITITGRAPFAYVSTLGTTSTVPQFPYFSVLFFLLRSLLKQVNCCESFSVIQYEFAYLLIAKW